jgi:nifR3 family TIM-barrel protein
MLPLQERSVQPIPFLLDKDVILAPMDGYTDHPFRLIARRFGSSVSFTEFINAIDVVGKYPHWKDRVIFSEEERPIVFQVLDNDPMRIEKAVRILNDLQPDGYDINLGCSSKHVSNRGAGSGLLRDPEKIRIIVRAMRQATPLPISAKIRLGWDADHMNYLDVSHLLQEEGISMLSVHGRTRQQAYSGEANWDAIAEIKRVVTIPVIGNGDIKTPVDIERIRSYTGCGAVVIGRAAIGNPWIFNKIPRSDIDLFGTKDVMEQHLSLMINQYGEKKGLILFRKFTVNYLKPFNILGDIKNLLLTQIHPDHFFQILNSIDNQPVQEHK